MARITQFNLPANENDAPKIAGIHRMIDMYKAEHRPITKLAALYEMLNGATEIAPNQRKKSRVTPPALPHD